MGGYTVTESCRGCIGHACKQACPKGAISIDNKHRASIDKSKCVNCGLCAKACPFGAIYNFRRPCQKACPVGAIAMDENLSAKIDYSKCIVCGSCTQKCPFGAIAAKTFITFVIEHLRKNILAEKKRPIYAMLAPSIVAQFPGISLAQIVEALKLLGFTDVVEVAVGADFVTRNETRELVEKKILTSSCCPAFIFYIKKFKPELADKISHNPSPMGQIGKMVKQQSPDALTVFIGPCNAKKDERSKPEVRPFVDYVLTFAELRAMFAARDIDLTQLKGVFLDHASPFGRGFARTGGLTDAVIQALKEMDINDFKVSVYACDGIRECIKALDDLASGKSPYNFIEGMSCVGGCVCGPESLTHNPIVGKISVQNHGKTAKYQTIADSLAFNTGENQPMTKSKSAEKTNSKTTNLVSMTKDVKPKPLPKVMSAEELIKESPENKQSEHEDNK
ncbi:MAG: monomeric [FeFe] hydrogenase [Mycoplasmoidaceae bacterium]|nr:monomeric [FeFe] hydrogenase [Mycoplasmoidaceae bacterium]